MAADADVAVLLRRGPSKKVLQVRWDLRNDQFEIGQWLFGKIYGESCDLSADGRFFTYQVNDGKYQSVPGGVYAVVCRPPYFTALALWQQGSNGAGFRFGGGGLFFASREPTRGSIPIPYRKLLRVGDTVLATVARGWAIDSRGPLVFTKQCSVGRLDWQVKESAWPGAYWLNKAPFDADWADVDRRGRLLMARKGKIFVMDAEGEREMIDLNPLVFQPLAPPRWATEWP